MGFDRGSRGNRGSRGRDKRDNFGSDDFGGGGFGGGDRFGGGGFGGAGGGLQLWPEGDEQTAQFTTLQWRRIVSPTVVNAARLSFSQGPWNSQKYSAIMIQAMPCIRWMCMPMFLKPPKVTSTIQ